MNDIEKQATKVMVNNKYFLFIIHDCFYSASQVNFTAVDKHY